MKNKTKKLRNSLFLTLSSSLLWISSLSAQSNLTWDITPGTVGEGNGTITGGTGTWNTTNGNWTLDAGVNNISWSNSGQNGTNLDNATFGGTAGTVTLAESISLRNLAFTNTAGAYTITGSTLNFTGGTITGPVSSAIESAIIRSNITGVPAINLQPMAGDRQFTLNPVASGSMVIGAVTGDGGNGSEKINLQGGAGSTGTIASVTGPKVIVTGGSWTINGASSGRNHDILGGTLTLNANLNATNRAVILGSTGNLNYNVASAVSASAANATSGDNGFRITGGTLDQTRGSAINTNASTTSIDLAGNLTFAGSNGANSNLHLGSGAVFLKGGNRQITVTNADTILTIGGVIQNDGTGTAPNIVLISRSLTKAGAGTLELRGASTYTGTTTVNAGTLRMGANNVFANTSNVVIGSATLDANTRTDTVGTLDVTGAAVINLGSGAALAFADSEAVDWAGGTLNITGTLEAISLRFGNETNQPGLTPAQLALISVNGAGTGTYVLDGNGYLIAPGGADLIPPTLTSITDDVSGGPVNVGSAVTYTVTFNEDIDETSVTAADFDNNGTADISVGAITETSAGVFTVVVTANSSGTLKLRIPTGAVIKDVAGNNLVVPVEDDTTITVQTHYQAWAGGANFDADANDDGVSNGLAFLLGASGPSVNAIALLPKVSESAGGLVMTFDMLNAASSGTATLSIEHSSDLGTSDLWEAVLVPAVDSTVSDVVFDISGSGPLGVQATIPASKAAGGKLFGRLKAVQP